MAAKQNSQVAKFLCSKGANIRALDLKGRTVLHYAALYSQSDFIEFLLDEHDFNIDIPDKDSSTPRHEAMSKGFVAVVKKLLERGAKIDAVSRGGYTTLDLAVQRAVFEEIVKVLLYRKVSIEALTSEGKTALYLAAEAGCVENVKLLLSKGANAYVYTAKDIRQFT